MFSSRGGIVATPDIDVSRKKHERSRHQRPDVRFRRLQARWPAIQNDSGQSARNG
jgi:hypothetical protein